MIETERLNFHKIPHILGRLARYNEDR